MLLGLIHNIALLIALSVGLHILARRYAHRVTYYHLAAGLLFGSVGIIGMITPVVFAPGVIYDGRSIVLALAGLFGGPITAAIAAGMCATFRISLGGVGAPVGVAVIIEASVLGVVLHYLRHRDERWVTPASLLAFGVQIHVIMMALQLLVPGVGWEIVRTIGLYVLIVYPIGFVLIAQAFLDFERRRSAERALTHSHDLMRYVIEHAPNAIAIHDKNLNYIYVSQRYRDDYNIPEQEVIGKHHYEVFPEIPEKWREVHRRALAGEVLNNDEEAFIRKDGSVDWTRWECRPWYEADGSIGGIVLYTEVITERKKAEEELRKTKDRLNTILHYSPLLIMECDCEGRYLLVNKAVCEFFAVEESQLIGKTYYEMLPTDVADEFMQRIDHMCETGEPIVIEDTLTINETTRVFESVLFPLFEGDHEVTSVASMAQEITGRKEVEEERRNLQEQYRQSQKMEAIGQLTGGVAHDFNNLLQVINACTELALMDIEESHPAAEPLREVIKAGDRAASLISQLLLFSRRKIMQPVALDLNEAVAEFLKMVERIIGEHIRLEWLPGNRLGAIHADRGMLEQAVMNLCLNARDAMPEGGVLTIETQNVLIDSEYCASHSWARPGRFILIGVTDTGYGMDSETLGHVFEPFFTTKREGRGTGLGLATVYGIVKQHDGMISAYSEVGKGSTFKIYLPLCERTAESVGTLITGKPLGGNETILLAEDDGAVQKLAQAILERAGYTVVVASDGAEALTLFREQNGTFDLVVLDVVMPVMGGREAYEKMRELRPNLLALFSSGYSKNAIHTDFVLEEGLTLLPKPYAPTELLRAVRTMLDNESAAT